MRASEPVGAEAVLALREASSEPAVSPAPPGVAPWIERIPGADWSPRWDLRVVMMLAALATALRLPNIARGYWVDEGISVGIAGHRLGAIPSLLRHDGSPPLFYYLLHFWLLCFGSSPVATHSLSILISVGVVFAAWWAARTLFGRAAGIAAAGLGATSPFLNWYSTETRMYTLVCGLSCIALGFVARAVRHRRTADAVWGSVAMTALIYTHNWGLYLFAVTAAVLLAHAVYDGDRVFARVVVLAAGAVLLAYAPWLPSFLVQARTTAAPWAVPPGVGDFFADPASMLGGTLGLVVAPLLVLGAWWTRSERRGSAQGGARLGAGDSVGLLLAVGLGTLVLGWLAANIEPSWTVRYLGVVFGPLVLASAGALATTSRGRAVIGAVCALCAGWGAIGSLLPNPSGGEAKSNVAAVTAAAAPDLRPGDVVVVAQTEQLGVVRHYLGPRYTYVTPTGPVADPTVVDWTDLVGRLTRADVCRTVLPSVAALPPGADILEINPLKAIGASGSTWSRAANGKVVAVDRLLAGQPSLLPTRSYAEATQPRPFSAVVGELFVKQAGDMSCV